MAEPTIPEILQRRGTTLDAKARQLYAIGRRLQRRAGAHARVGEFREADDIEDTANAYLRAAQDIFDDIRASRRRWR